MTEQEAIELATKYQEQRHRSVKIARVHRVSQEKMDELAEWSGKSRVAEWPEWMRPLAHWVVRFDRGWKTLPDEYVISVYDDGYVAETPAL
jgi:hypothetical protein